MLFFLTAANILPEFYLQLLCFVLLRKRKAQPTWPVAEGERWSCQRKDVCMTSSGETNLNVWPLYDRGKYIYKDLLCFRLEMDLKFRVSPKCG